jgi:hypothetical protein
MWLKFTSVEEECMPPSSTWNFVSLAVEFTLNLSVN